MKRHITLFKIITLNLAIGLSILAQGQATYTTSTFAGSGTAGSTNGTGTSASFNNPLGIDIGPNGNLYITERQNPTIRKITPSGVVTTLAGSTTGYSDATGTSAQFNTPYDLTVSKDGDVFVADIFNNRIRKVTSSGTVTTFAGSTGGFSDGTGAGAQFNYPYSITIDTANNLYVFDLINRRIRKITPSGIVTTLAGNGTVGSTNGTGTGATFNNVPGMCCDDEGNLYIASVLSHTIRKVTPLGVVTTFAGSSGNSGGTDGSLTNARFSGPFDISIDNEGTLYVSDESGRRVRMIRDGQVYTLGGDGTTGYVDGNQSLSRFSILKGIATNNNGGVFICDYTNNRIRKISIPTCTDSSQLPTTLNTTYTSNFTKTEGTWTHFCTEAGELLLSLDTNGTGALVNADEIQLKLGAQTTYGYLGVDGGIVDTDDEGYQMIDRRWDVNPTAQPTTGNVGVRFYFTNDEYNDVKDSLLLHGPGQNGANKSTVDTATELNFYKSTSGAAFADPQTVSGIVISNGSIPDTSTWVHSTHGTADHTAEFRVSSFSGGAAAGGGGGGITAAPLPVELVSFKVSPSANNTQALLQWSTATENNNRGFSVQKASHGNVWTEIGYKHGQGISNSMVNYKFIDISPTAGKNFYRLVQEDYDGTRDISVIRMLNFSGRDAGIVIYPNPTKDRIFITTQSDGIHYDYRLTNSAGLTIISGSGSGQTSIDCSTVVSGVYYLSIYSENNKTVERITIAK